MRTLKVFLILMLSAFALKAQTHVKFDLRDPSFGITSTTGRTVIVQAEGRPSSVGNVVLLSYRLSGVTDTNGCITFSNLFGSSISGFYHVTVPAPPLRSDFDIWVQSTNLGLVAASTIRGVFGATTYPSSAFAWAADVSDQRYANITNSGGSGTTYTNRGDLPVGVIFGGAVGTNTDALVKSLSGFATNLFISGTADTLIRFASQSGLAFDIDHIVDGSAHEFDFVATASPNSTKWVFAGAPFDNSVETGHFVSSGIQTNVFQGYSQMGLAEITRSRLFIDSFEGDSVIVAATNGQLEVGATVQADGFITSIGSFTGNHVGNGSSLNSLNASSLSSGVLPDGVSTNNAHTNWTFTGGTFSGNGNGLTNLNASSIASGAIEDRALTNRTHTNLTLLNPVISNGSTNLFDELNKKANTNAPVIPNATLFGLKLPIYTNTVFADIGASNTPFLNVSRSNFPTIGYVNGNIRPVVEFKEFNESSNRVYADFAAHSVFLRDESAGSAAVYGTTLGGNVFPLIWFDSLGMTSIGSPANRAVIRILDANDGQHSARIDGKFRSTGTAIFDATITATNGFISVVTNTLAFTAVSSCTNTLGYDATASVSAGTAVIIQDRFGNTIDNVGTIATLHVLIPLRKDMRLSGTGVSCVIY